MYPKLKKPLKFKLSRHDTHKLPLLYEKSTLPSAFASKSIRKVFHLHAQT